VRNAARQLLTVATALLMICGPVAPQNAADGTGAPNPLFVAAGKSVVVSSAELIERVSVGSADVAEAFAVSPHEVLVNAKVPGSTSLIVWQQGGGKLFFDINVSPNRFLADARLQTVRREIGNELPGQTVSVSSDNGVYYLRGTVKDLTSAQRALAIASSEGKVVNLLYVNIPEVESQILLKVRFMSLDRTLANQLGFNLFSTGATNTMGSIGTGQYPAPTLPTTPTPSNITNPFVFSDILNIFLFRKDLNLGATIKDLETKGIIQTLAEPNVLAQDKKQASFLAGGEFPYPVFQGTAGGTGAVTIQFREFGVRLNFIPTITPRNTIKLQVAPEVSALDFANGLTISGFTVPALTTRKMKTEVELNEGQTFAIGGLLDRRVTDTFEKMPFIGDIPIIGKMFQSRNLNKSNTELIVIVTPELVRPVPAGGPVPQGPQYPVPFLGPDNPNAVRTPGLAVTGPVPVTPPTKSMPVEKLLQSLQPGKELNTTSTTSVYANPPESPQPETNVTAPEQPPAAPTPPDK
jgi:pilus assembly protein CpaC